MRRWACATCLLVLVATARAAEPATPPVAATEPFFQAYSGVLANPEEMLPVLREIAGADARVIYIRDTGRVLVNGTPAAHAAVRSALAELTRPRRNVRIAVAFAGQGRASDTGASVSGGGRVLVTPSGTSYQVSVQPQAHANQTTASTLSQQQILTQSGSEASIAVGEEVPYLQDLLVYGRRWGYVTQTVEMRQVGAFLRVRPTVVGDGPMVNVVLTPEISGMVDGNPQHIRYTKVATEVTVQDGQSITIGGYGENAEFYSRFLAGLNTSRKSTDTQITLTVNLDPETTP